MSCLAGTSSGQSQHIEVGGDEQRVEPVLILCQPTIWNLLESKLLLDDAERVLHLTAHRGFPAFDVALPVNSSIGHFWQTLALAIDAVINRRKMRICLDFFMIQG